ncbi:putative porin [Winogradskyella immobilis]|uniref:Porin n=1 Tax=Winogradskyella immobilis TaxID=2816852 RepID=A0ABS8ENQ7_9FLAO|nr:putative porin [Winogradskyella immobilis]MCC1483942.1 putative porin [Winogradskyella immobilis]MCG0016035.1 putative porin [Winogradskyella immobilis]
MKFFKSRIIFIAFLLVHVSFYAQPSNVKTLPKNNKANIELYNIVDLKNDSTYVDTTLTIKKDYKYNYLRKDNFNLIQFANIGQTYNTLSFDASSNKTLPLFGARAKHFNYMEVDDINYYHVPTPLTELFYKTAFEQGQVLDAFFTVNTSKQFNFSIAYKGLRSLGNYENVLTSTGNFRFTTNYKSKNNRYNMRGHIVTQDLSNQENGGLSDADVERFINGEEEVLDRSIFEPNFDNAENILEGERFYLNHQYSLINKKDSLSNNKLSINNIISFEDKFYRFTQSNVESSFFGNAFTNEINDEVTLEHFYSEFGAIYSNNILGNFAFNINYTDINYGYDSLVLLEGESITNRIKTSFIGFNGSYSKQIGKLKIDGSIGANLSNNIEGNYLDTAISYNLFEDIKLRGSININSRLPNYNQLLYQSDYINYNWDNQSEFDNINTQQISLSLLSDKYLNANIDISNIDNYTFFNLVDTVEGVNVIRPEQYNESLQYLRVKLQKEFKLGKFSLDNTIMYQNVTSSLDVLNVPAFITRNTLYFTDDIFDKALKFQTGITFNYFSEYNGNGYDPLLAEFYTQNETEIGGFPRLDFFINAKIRQTRIFLKAEHFNSSFTGFDFFSAPNNPYRDFNVRFGLVWNFFI